MSVISPNADAVRTARYRSVGRRVWCDTDLPAPLIESLRTGDMDRVLFSATPLQVKDRCVVGRYQTEGHTFLVKRHAWGGLGRTFRSAFREPSSAHCARIGTYLHSLGVRTPKPRGTVDFRLGPWNYRSYLVSDYVEGIPLYQCIRFGTQTEFELRHLARQVAQLWQQLITLGVSHNDFKLENFIVDEDSRLWIIDFEKTRVAGRPERQRARQIADVLNFLHVRGWHSRPDARAIFAEAFLQVPSGQWLKGIGLERVVMGLGLDEHESDAGLSVVVLCHETVDSRQCQTAIRSVRDIADEVVLVDPSACGEFELLKCIEPINGRTNEPDRVRPFKLAAPLSSVARFPWMLVLHQNEYVTPFLAKELQQRICMQSEATAYRLGRKLEYFGRTIHDRDVRPVRLFQTGRCEVSLVNGEPVCAAETSELGELQGAIQASESSSISELIAQLNDASTQAAINRLRAGERPRLLKGWVRGVVQFLMACARPSGVRSGWTGVQVALIRNAFTWLEEAKLYQHSAEFGAHDERTAELISITANQATTVEANSSLPAHAA